MALLALALAAAKQRAAKPEELTNFSLGPRYSQWLVGAVSQIATAEEIRGFLAVGDDASAQAFIDEFWEARRSSDSPWPADQPRAIFERRADEADGLYTEGAYLGRYSDRGVIHILYGPPREVRYDTSVRRGSQPVEVWSYAKDAAAGLDGSQPKRAYYFRRQGDRTVLSAPDPKRSPIERPF